MIFSTTNWLSIQGSVHFCPYTSFALILTASMPDQPNNSAAIPACLPALLSSPIALLPRTQTTLSLLQNVLQESSTEYWYERGKKAIECENWSEAEYALKQCINLDQKHWRGALHLTVVLAKLQKPKSSAECLLAAYQGSYMGWWNFEEGLELSRWQFLHDYFDNYINNHAHGFDILLALVLILRVKKEIKAARKALDEMYSAFKQEIRSSSIWHRTSGAIWYDEFKKAESFASYSQAISLNKSCMHSYFERGFINRVMSNHYESIDDYTASIEIDANHAETYFFRGLVKSKIAEIDGALADFDRAIQINNDYAAIFYHRGQIRHHDDDYTKALEDYCRAIFIKSSYEEKILTDIFHRAQAKSGEQDIDFDHRHASTKAKGWKQSLPEHEFAVKVGPRNPRAFIARGYVRLNLLDYSGSLSDFDFAIELAPNSVRAFKGRALTKKALGDIVGSAIDSAIAEQLDAIAIASEHSS